MKLSDLKPGAADRLRQAQETFLRLHCAHHAAADAGAQRMSHEALGAWYFHEELHDALQALGTQETAWEADARVALAAALRAAIARGTQPFDAVAVVLAANRNLDHLRRTFVLHAPLVPHVVRGVVAAHDALLQQDKENPQWPESPDQQASK